MSDHTPGIIHEAPLYNIIADFGIGVKSHCLQISFSSCTTEETMIWNNLVYGEMEFMGFHLKKAFVKREVPGLTYTPSWEWGPAATLGRKEGADVSSGPMNGYFHRESFPSEWNGFLNYA